MIISFLVHRGSTQGAPSQRGERAQRRGFAGKQLGRRLDVEDLRRSIT
jgi:hypothetical protein